MNWKGFGRKRSCYIFKVTSRHSLGGAEEIHEKPQSVKPISGTRFEPGTSQIRNRSINHSTTTLGAWLLDCVIYILVRTVSNKPIMFISFYLFTWFVSSCLVQWYEVSLTVLQTSWLQYECWRVCPRLDSTVVIDRRPISRTSKLTNTFVWNNMLC
jgi:hypothetical protein